MSPTHICFHRTAQRKVGERAAERARSGLPCFELPAGVRPFLPFVEKDETRVLFIAPSWLFRSNFFFLFWFSSIRGDGGCCTCFPSHSLAPPPSLSTCSLLLCGGVLLLRRFVTFFFSVHYLPVCTPDGRSQQPWAKVVAPRRRRSSASWTSRTFRLSSSTGLSPWASLASRSSSLVNGVTLVPPPI